MDDLPPEQLPSEFVARMRELLGASEAAALFAALARPAEVGLRLNSLRGAQLGGDGALAAALPWHKGRWRMTPVPWCETAYVVTETGAATNEANTTAVPNDAADPASKRPLPPGRHPYQVAGAYYLQDPAATVVAEALAPEPGELVLDLAAAPGGKSTHLAALMAGEGWLVANDVHPLRAQALVGNLERCGVGNATVTSEPLDRLAQAWPGRFDRVLLDAPCSGEGMFRKSTDALAMWSPENVAHCAARQDELLLAAARLVRPGGYLAYSTCTLNPDENEGSVARFVAVSGFEVVPLDLPGTAPGRPEWSGGAPLPALAGAARIWPHLAPGEGHFVALLRRPTTTEPTGEHTGEHMAPAGSRKRGRGRDPGPSREVLAAWRDFAADVLTQALAEALAPTALQGEWLLRAAAGTPPLEDLRWLRHGLQLGQVRVGARSTRIEPAHALAMWAPPGSVTRRLDLAADDERVSAYLRGEDVVAPGEPGYLRVEVDGLPLGWGKRSGAVVRSLLPKGLRRG